jgi:hypothetical protein
MDQNTINIIFALLLAILFILYFCNNTYENLTPLSNESIQNLSSVYNNGTLTVGNIVATGNVSIGGALTTTGAATINGQFIAKNGSDFSGGTHRFSDVEGGKIRIGAPWGKSGIFSELGDLTIGSVTGITTVQNGQSTFGTGGTFAAGGSITTPGNVTAQGTLGFGAAGSTDYTFWGDPGGLRICVGPPNDSNRYGIFKKNGGRAWGQPNLFFG